MITADTSWQTEFDAWLAPFLAHLGRKEQRRWAPVYRQGLLGPGERKSVGPMAARVAPGEVQQRHHFVAASPWATAPLEEEPVRQAERLVGGPEAVLVIDDAALVKQGKHSVGVARQYCGELGERANCQALVSLTPARREVPVGVALRLFLPAAWAADAARRAKAGVPGSIPGRPKWRLALDELDRVRAAGATFGGVPADAEHGKAAAFRGGLSERAGCPGRWASCRRRRSIPPTSPWRRPRCGPPAGRPAGQAPGAFGQERGGQGALRRPARDGVADHRVAARHQGRPQRRVRRAARAGGGRPRGRACGWRTAPWPRAAPSICRGTRRGWSASAGAGASANTT